MGKSQYNTIIGNNLLRGQNCSVSRFTLFNFSVFQGPNLKYQITNSAVEKI